MKKLILTIIILLAVSIISFAQINEFKITASDGAPQDWFGYSVTVSGDYAIVRVNNFYNKQSGQAYIFERGDTTWIGIVKVVSSYDNEIFGASIAISDEYTFIGTPRDDNLSYRSGSVYIFKRFGINWLEEAEIRANPICWRIL